MLTLHGLIQVRALCSSNRGRRGLVNSITQFLQSGKWFGRFCLHILDLQCVCTWRSFTFLAFTITGLSVSQVSTEFEDWQFVYIFRSLQGCALMTDFCE